VQDVPKTKFVSYKSRSSSTQSLIQQQKLDVQGSRQLAPIVSSYPWIVCMRQTGEIVSESASTATYSLCFILSVCRATELNHTLISLLQDLSIRVDGEDQQKIHDTIDAVSSLSSDAYVWVSSAWLTQNECR
jgi:hypothetical protein